MIQNGTKNGTWDFSTEARVRLLEEALSKNADLAFNRLLTRKQKAAVYNRFTVDRDMHAVVSIGYIELDVGFRKFGQLVHCRP